ETTGLLSNIEMTLTLFNGAETVQTQAFTNANIIDLGGKLQLGFIAEDEYDAIRIDLKNNGVLATIKVFHAIVRAFEAGDLACNESTLLTTPEFPLSTQVN